MIINKKIMDDYVNKVINYFKRHLINIISLVADILPTRTEILSEKKLIFIAGIEGSGTTLLNKLLSEPENAISITHHNYIQADIVNMSDKAERISEGSFSSIKKFQHLTTVKKFNFLVDKIWKFPYNVNKDNKDEILMSLRNLKIPVFISNVVIKRSYPSGKQGMIFPNLDDLFDISKDVKIIHVERNFEENCASILRRRFVSDIDDAVERLRNAKTILISQLDSIENTKVLYITYEDLVKNTFYILYRLESFIGYERGELTKFISWVGEGSTESRRILEENRTQFAKNL